MTYDNNGNLTSITDVNGTTLYNWNARNQLEGISGPNVNASFVYDGLGRREKKTINGNLTEFLYDGFNPVQETSGANVLANILGGLGIDEYFTRTDSSGTHSFLTDFWTTIALSNFEGSLETEYTYEPFGKATVTGTSNTNPFQYTGREYDGSDLYYYRARYYHSGLQRFVSEDPIEFLSGDVNLFLYVSNNPIRYVDPFGLEKNNTRPLSEADKVIQDIKRAENFAKAVADGLGAALDMACGNCYPGPSDLIKSAIDIQYGRYSEAKDRLNQSVADPLGVGRRNGQ